VSVGITFETYQGPLQQQARTLKEGLEHIHSIPITQLILTKMY